jgi:hypothetical protein
MSAPVNRFLQALMWPVAALLLWMVWPMLCASWAVMTHLLTHAEAHRGLVIGLVIGGVWVWGLKAGRELRYFLHVLEHELTHALFAVLTLHRVESLHATRGEGGYLQASGQGNWLITLSPYFFPTWCVLPLLLVTMAKPTWRPWAEGLLGLALVLHIEGSRREFHPQQTDLRKYHTGVSWVIALGGWGLGVITVFWFTPGLHDVVSDAWHWMKFW